MEEKDLFELYQDYTANEGKEEDFFTLLTAYKINGDINVKYTPESYKKFQDAYGEQKAKEIEEQYKSYYTGTKKLEDYQAKSPALFRTQSLEFYGYDNFINPEVKDIEFGIWHNGSGIPLTTLTYEEQATFNGRVLDFNSDDRVTTFIKTSPDDIRANDVTIGEMTGDFFKAFLPTTTGAIARSKMLSQQPNFVMAHNKDIARLAEKGKTKEERELGKNIKKLIDTGKLKPDDYYFEPDTKNPIWKTVEGTEDMSRRTVRAFTGDKAVLQANAIHEILGQAPYTAFMKGADAIAFTIKATDDLFETAIQGNFTRGAFMKQVIEDAGKIVQNREQSTLNYNKYIGWSKARSASTSWEDEEGVTDNFVNLGKGVVDGVLQMAMMGGGVGGTARVLARGAVGRTMFRRIIPAAMRAVNKKKAAEKSLNYFSKSKYSLDVGKAASSGGFAAYAGSEAFKEAKLKGLSTREAYAMAGIAGAIMLVTDKLTGNPSQFLFKGADATKYGKFGKALVNAAQDEAKRLGIPVGKALSRRKNNIIERAFLMLDEKLNKGLAPILAEGLQEGSQEFLEDLTFNMAKVAYDEISGRNAYKMSLHNIGDNLFESFLIGGITGGIIQSPRAITKTVSSLLTKSSSQDYVNDQLQNHISKVIGAALVNDKQSLLVSQLNDAYESRAFSENSEINKKVYKSYLNEIKMKSTIIGKLKQAAKFKKTTLTRQEIFDAIDKGEFRHITKKDLSALTDYDYSRYFMEESLQIESKKSDLMNEITLQIARDSDPELFADIDNIKFFKDPQTVRAYSDGELVEEDTERIKGKVTAAYNQAENLYATHENKFKKLVELEKGIETQKRREQFGLDNNVEELETEAIALSKELKNDIQIDEIREIFEVLFNLKDYENAEDIRLKNYTTKAFFEFFRFNNILSGDVGLPDDYNFLQYLKDREGKELYDELTTNQEQRTERIERALKKTKDLENSFLDTFNETLLKELMKSPSRGEYKASGVHQNELNKNAERAKLALQPPLTSLDNTPPVNTLEEGKMYFVTHFASGKLMEPMLFDNGKLFKLEFNEEYNAIIATETNLTPEQIDELTDSDNSRAYAQSFENSFNVESNNSKLEDISNVPILQDFEGSIYVLNLNNTPVIREIRELAKEVNLGGFFQLFRKNRKRIIENIIITPLTPGVVPSYLVTVKDGQVKQIPKDSLVNPKHVKIGGLEFIIADNGIIGNLETPLQSEGLGILKQISTDFTSGGVLRVDKAAKNTINTVLDTLPELEQLIEAVNTDEKGNPNTLIALKDLLSSLKTTVSSTRPFYKLGPELNAKQVEVDRRIDKLVNDLNTNKQEIILNPWEHNKGETPSINLIDAVNAEVEVKNSTETSGLKYENTEVLKELLKDFNKKLNKDKVLHIGQIFDNESVSIDVDAYNELINAYKTLRELYIISSQNRTSRTRNNIEYVLTYTEMISEYTEKLKDANLIDNTVFDDVQTILNEEFTVDSFMNDGFNSVIDRLHKAELKLKDGLQLSKLDKFLEGVDLDNVFQQYYSSANSLKPKEDSSEALEHFLLYIMHLNSDITANYLTLKEHINDKDAKDTFLESFEQVFNAERTILEFLNSDSNTDTVIQKLKNAVSNFAEDILFVRGGAGSGKTMFIIPFIEKQAAKTGKSVLLTSAQPDVFPRVSTSITDVEKDYKKLSNLDKDSGYDIIIIDESTMVEVGELNFKTLQETTGAKIILLGDEYQSSGMETVKKGSRSKITVLPQVYHRNYRVQMTTPILQLFRSDKVQSSQLQAKIRNFTASLAELYVSNMNNNLELTGDASAFEAILARGLNNLRATDLSYYEENGITKKGIKATSEEQLVKDFIKASENGEDVALIIPLLIHAGGGVVNNLQPYYTSNKVIITGLIKKYSELKDHKERIFLSTQAQGKSWSKVFVPASIINLTAPDNNNVNRSLRHLVGAMTGLYTAISREKDALTISLANLESNRVSNEEDIMEYPGLKNSDNSLKAAAIENNVIIKKTMNAFKDPRASASQQPQQPQQPAETTEVEEIESTAGQSSSDEETETINNQATNAESQAKETQSPKPQTSSASINDGLESTPEGFSEDIENTETDLNNVLNKYC